MFWIVKLGKVVISRPMTINEASKFAEAVVAAQGDFTSVTIEFYAEVAE